MVPGDNPVMLEVKAPVPVPLDVVLSAVVGLGDVLQHTPRAVTAAPPSDVTLPPLSAEVEVILETTVVFTVGSTAAVVNIKSLPYDVPTLLVA